MGGPEVPGPPRARANGGPHPPRRRPRLGRHHRMGLDGGGAGLRLRAGWGPGHRAGVTGRPRPPTGRCPGRRRPGRLATGAPLAGRGPLGPGGGLRRGGVGRGGRGARGRRGGRDRRRPRCAEHAATDRRRAAAGPGPDHPGAHPGQPLDLPRRRRQCPGRAARGRRPPRPRWTSGRSGRLCGPRGGGDGPHGGRRAVGAAGDGRRRGLASGSGALRRLRHDAGPTLDHRDPGGGHGAQRGHRLPRRAPGRARLRGAGPGLGGAGRPERPGGGRRVGQHLRGRRRGPSDPAGAVAGHRPRARRGGLSRARRRHRTGGHGGRAPRPRPHRGPALRARHDPPAAVGGPPGPRLALRHDRTGRRGRPPDRFRAGPGADRGGGRLGGLGRLGGGARPRPAGDRSAGVAGRRRRRCAGGRDERPARAADVRGPAPDGAGGRGPGGRARCR